MSVVVDGSPNINNGFVFWDAHKVSIEEELLTYNKYYSIKPNGYMLQRCTIPTQKFKRVDISVGYSSDARINSGASLNIKFAYKDGFVDVVELPLVYSYSTDNWIMPTAVYSKTRDVTLANILVSIRNNSKHALNVHSVQISINSNDSDASNNNDFLTYAILYGTEDMMPVL